MRGITRNIVLSLMLLLPAMTTGQEDIRQVIEEVIDHLADSYEEGTDFSAITDRLYDLAEEKVPVNSAGEQALSQIPLLSGYQINRLLAHRRRYGDFETIYELQAMDGFDKRTLQLLAPFITLDQQPESFSGSRRLYLNHDLMIRTATVLQQQKGYISDSGGSQFFGDQRKNYLRYIVDADIGEAGITADKDAGEPFFSGHNPEGFDFYSGHLYLEDLGKVEKVALGDYSLQYGQGLNLWSGFTMGKTTTISGAKKLAYGIRPYRSATEGGFFRGAAVSVGSGKLTADAFFSQQRHDANRVYNADSSDYSVTSIDIGGYHRTDNELEDQNSLKETLYGMNTSYDYQGLHLGVTAYLSRYSHSIIPQEQLYNRFRFSGDESFIKGADFSWVMKHAEWFAEGSLDKENDFAWLAGANFYLHPRLVVNVLYRDYDKKYNNLYASAAGEYSHSNNEQGWLYGLRLDIHENWYFKGYIDFFSSDWFQYGSETPSDGTEIEGRLSYIPDRDNSAYLRLFYEEKVVNIQSSNTMQQTGVRERMKVRLHFSKTIDNVELRSRAEKSVVALSGSKSNGFLVYQDAIVSVGEAPLKIYGRYALFETDDYSSRVYAYENDVLYAFSFPAYYYKGNRYFVMLSYKWKRMSFWLRYASTTYRDRKPILSGLNEIDGNTVSEIKFQVRVKM